MSTLQRKSSHFQAIQNTQSQEERDNQTKHMAQQCRTKTSVRKQWRIVQELGKLDNLHAASVSRGISVTVISFHSLKLNNNNDLLNLPRRVQ